MTAEAPELLTDATDFVFGVAAPDANTEGGGNWIRSFRDNGDYRLRFLQEWEEWTAIWDHFSNDKHTSYPCTGNRRTCPGCNVTDPREKKANRRFIVNALLMTKEIKGRGKEKGDGRPHLWKIPGSLREMILRQREKNGDSLTRHDITIIRYEEPSGVKYTLEGNAAEPMDLSVFELCDPQEALRDEWMGAWDPKTREANESERAAYRATAAEVKADDKADEAADAHVDEPVPDALKSKEERAAEAQAAIDRGDDPLNVFAGSKHPGLAIVPDPEPPVAPRKVTSSSIKAASLTELDELYHQAGFPIPEDLVGDQPKLAAKLLELLS